MKTNKIYMTIILCIGVITCAIYFFAQYHRTTYEFSPKTSLAFFGVKPKQFFEIYYDYYGECEDFRNSAEINEKGNLVIHLTKKQEKVFLRSCDSQIDKIKKINGIYISDDYTELSITGNSDKVAEIIANKLPVFTVFDLANRQLIINKINPENIVVKVKVFDEANGNCVYDAVWPKENIDFSVKEWQFSE